MIVRSPMIVTRVSIQADCHFWSVLPKPANHRYLRFPQIPSEWLRVGHHCGFNGLEVYVQHVYPEDDGYPHRGTIGTAPDMLYSPECPCHPRVEMADTLAGRETGIIVVHNDMSVV